MEIKILGAGCPKCKTLELNVKKALSELGVTADVQKVTDINRIMDYGIMMTPGLVINGKVRSSGRLPMTDEIIAMIEEEI